MEYEFNLDGAIENLDSVPDDLKHFYTQGDGGYRVAPNMVGAAKRMNGLGANLKTERAKKTEANREAQNHRQSASGFTAILSTIAELPEDKRNPEGLKAYIDELTTKAAAGGRKGEEAARQLEAVKAEMTKSHNTALETVRGELKGMEGSLFKYMVGDVANTALAEHKGNPLFLRPHIDRLTKVVKEGDNYEVRVLDEKGEIRYNGEGNPMTVPELVATLKKDERFAPAFEGRVASGNGVTPSKKTTTTSSQNSVEKTAKQKIEDGLRARRGR